MPACSETEKCSSCLFSSCRDRTCDLSDNHSSALIHHSASSTFRWSLHTPVTCEAHYQLKYRPYLTGTYRTHTIRLLDHRHTTDLQPAEIPLQTRREQQLRCVCLSALCPIDDLQRRNQFTVQVHAALTHEGELTPHDSEAVELKIIWSH